MFNRAPRKPSALIAFLGLLLALLGAQSNPVSADLITDFDGYEIELDVNVISDGGQSFSVNLVGSNTATIGAGHEFTLNVGASGFTTKPIRIDIDNQGLVNAYADSQFAIGNTGFSDFSFDVTFSLSEAEITSAVSSGSMIRGSASVSGLDPVVWTFINESDNSFGKVMTFGPIDQNTPKVQISACTVPEPSSLTLTGLISTVLLSRRRRLQAKNR